MPPRRNKGTQRPRNILGTIKRIFSYLKPKYKFFLVIVSICIIISSLMSVVSNIFIQSIIDDYVSPMLSNGTNLFPGLLRQIGILCIIYLVSVFATYLYNYLMVIISQNVLRTIRNDMFRKMQGLPVKYFDTHTHGDIMSHYTNDTDTMERLLSSSVPDTISAILTLTATFIRMLTISLYLTLAVVVFIIFALIIVKTVGKKSAIYFTAQQKTLGEATGFIEEMINGAKVVKVFNHEEETKKDFDKINEKLFENSKKANKYANIFMPIMANMGHIQYVAIAILGGVLAISGATNLNLAGLSIITLGQIIAFLQLSRTFHQPITRLSQEVNSIIVALAGAERIFDLMDEKDEVDEGTITLVNIKKEGEKLVETAEKTNMWAWKDVKDNKVILTELKGDVRFFDVDFGYTDEKLVLKNISLYAKPGEKVAFVGSTGAGKTTITNLINRFYDVDDGKIRFDNININRIKKSDLRHSIGMVLQETNLFTGTVKENIRYGNLLATDEDIYKACKLAGADDFIQKLPMGYDTILKGDGSNLSQGQRQLLSIARAEVANAPVMILDEATSSIDTHTEKLVEQGMSALMQGRTVFVIAHRLSTVHNSNVIMVLENGEIIERGNHEELIKQKGEYYKLYTGKFELE